MPEIVVNEELLDCIKKVQFMTLDYKPLSFKEIENMKDNDTVRMTLICEENPKFKLKDRHYATLKVGEAKIYIQLGIEEGEIEC